MDGPILVTGGTGTLGRPLVDRLLGAGAGVRVMSRRPRRAGDDRPCEWAVADLGNGEGLDAAVQGVGAIVHCATNGRTDVRQMRRLIQQVHHSGGTPHLVYISIVGVDRIPFFYYHQKLAAERLLESSGLPWTIQRATQFHDLVAGVSLAQRRLPVVFSLRGLRAQPIEVSEVAGRLAELVQAPPVGRAPDMGGPEVHTADEAAEMVMRALGRRRRVVSLPVPGKTAAAFREGHNLCPEHAVGTGTFAEYLNARAARAHPSG